MVQTKNMVLARGGTGHGNAIEVIPTMLEFEFAAQRGRTVSTWAGRGDSQG